MNQTLILIIILLSIYLLRNSCLPLGGACFGRLCIAPAGVALSLMKWTFLRGFARADRPLSDVLSSAA